MLNYKKDFENRVAFIRETAEKAGAKGIVFGNSGGKDSALVGILCKVACPDTVGLIMPCDTVSNYNEDKSDAELLAEGFGIETRVIDLTLVKKSLVSAIVGQSADLLFGNNSKNNGNRPSSLCLEEAESSMAQPLNRAASANIAPRLRMAALYAVAADENRLVAGTGNRSETYMGYFTKWGDGACDFNPISDLTVSEVYEFLRLLKAPENILRKAPSGGLFDGQTDEAEMGISYKKIDEYLLYGNASDSDRALIENFHSKTEHKRVLPKTFL